MLPLFTTTTTTANFTPSGRTPHHHHLLLLSQTTACRSTTLEIKVIMTPEILLLCNREIKRRTTYSLQPTHLPVDRHILQCYSTLRGRRPEMRWWWIREGCFVEWNIEINISDAIVKEVEGWRDVTLRCLQIMVRWCWLLSNSNAWTSPWWSSLYIFLYVAL